MQGVKSTGTPYTLHPAPLAVQNTIPNVTGTYWIPFVSMTPWSV